ncbi:MAG: hypothetical protein ACI92E_002203 [Oceanicoccus sp.]|jgi:hypothetical protein
MNVSELFHSPFSSAHSAVDRQPNSGPVTASPSSRNDFSSSELTVSSFSRSEVSVSISLSKTSLYLSSRHNEAPPVKGKIKSEEITPSELLSKKSADTILGFIENHLQAKRAAGATSEELSNTIAAAIKGFEQGYLGAVESLGGLDSLPNGVAEGIVETGRLVHEGIAALQKEFTAGDKGGVLPSQSAAQQKVTEFSQLQTVAAGYAESYRRNENVDLQLKTNDGDIVTLSFSGGHSSEVQASFYSDQSSALYALQQSSSSSANFSLSIQGELDEGEIAALNELLSEVGALSGEFFKGDFQTAYAMALDFELDFSEFSQFSLDLALTTHTQIVDSYVAEETSGYGENSSFGSVDLPKINAQLFDNITIMIDHMTKLLEKAEKFDDPKQLLTDLLANHLAQKNLSDQQLLSGLKGIS